MASSDRGGEYSSPRDRDRMREHDSSPDRISRDDRRRCRRRRSRSFSRSFSRSRSRSRSRVPSGKKRDDSKATARQDPALSSVSPADARSKAAALADMDGVVGVKISDIKVVGRKSRGSVKKPPSPAKEAAACPPEVRGKRGASSAASGVASGDGGGVGGCGCDGDSADGGAGGSARASAEKSLKLRLGDDWRAKEGVQAAEVLEAEVEKFRVLELQQSGELPPSEDPKKKPRKMGSLLIRKASKKLPRDVHRTVLDLFQVMILEPYHYPPVAELRVSLRSCQRATRYPCGDIVCGRRQ